jgi:hypothetical protein
VPESLFTAKGDLIAGTSAVAGTEAKLAVGANDTRLVADSAQVTGLKWVADTVNAVVTTAGDILYATASKVITRLGIGTAGQPLVVNAGATAPQWGFDTQTANKVYAGPSSGASAAPGFRVLTGFDVPLRSYLAGLTLSTAGSSATITTAAGFAVDGGNTQGMVLASSLDKTTSAWAVGNAQGGLDTGAIANSTWYHFWLIMRPDTGVVDMLISLSASAPTMPANYTLKRRIGSGKIDGAGKWTAFTQDGDYFRWAASVADVAAAAPGTAAVSRTLTVPIGVNVFALFTATMGSDTSPTALFSDLAANDEAPNATGLGMIVSIATYGGQGAFQIRTNTSAQVRSRLSASSAGTTLYMQTYGWIDSRGRNA